MQLVSVLHACAFVMLCHSGSATGHGDAKDDDVIRGVRCYVCDDCVQPFQPTPADQQSHCAYCGYASSDTSRITRTCHPLVTNAKGKAVSRPTPPYDDCYSEHRSLVQCYCRTDDCNLYTGPPTSSSSSNSGNKSRWTPVAVIIVMFIAATVFVILACTVCRHRRADTKFKTSRY